MTFRQVAILLSFLVATPSLADTTSTFTLPSGVGVTIIEAAFQEKKFDIEGCSENSSSCRRHLSTQPVRPRRRRGPLSGVARLLRAKGYRLSGTPQASDVS